jgi:cell division protein FtsW (lipid II flippase)
MSYCSGWCWPLIIYVIIVAVSFISVIVSNNPEMQKRTGLIWNIIWAIVLGVILYYICRNCKEQWAWFLLLLPLIIMAIIIAIYILGYSMGTGLKTGMNDYY